MHDYVWDSIGFAEGFEGICQKGAIALVLKSWSACKQYQLHDIWV
jgi:hypothetical protein